MSVQKNFWGIGIGVFLMGNLSPFGTEPAAGRDREILCKGTIGKITVQNLKVPSGYTCTLRGAKVKGQITVEKNATLTTDRARIKGNIIAFPGNIIQLDPKTRIDGQIMSQPE